MSLTHAPANPLAQLNRPQREAVLTVSGPLLVLAGAGTGKTRVITYRIAELIRRGTPPERILSVTFTNKAAKEMQERTTALLGRRLKQKPTVSTFHAFCVKVLRLDIDALGYPKDFAIYDRGDQESAARAALRDIRVPEKSLKPGDLLSRISRWKSAGVDSSRAGDFVEDDVDVLAASAYRRYQRNLQTSGAVDFDDLLLLTHKLFHDFPEILERHQRRFDHVQIDEYQDTNGLQFKLVESLVRPHRSICVVGDDDQSIYGWRGAEVEHILNFQHHFPGAKVVRLEDNYRCTDHILEIANRLVRHNRGRHDKSLIAHKTAPESVRFKQHSDEVTEAEQTAREIRFWIDAKGVLPEHIAILFRTNEQSRIFETELRRAKVPYVLIGGQSFFDRKEIRDLLAYLKAILHPRDEVSLLRIINVPVRGIGESTVEKLLARAVRERRSLWDVIPDARAAGEIPPKAVTALESFRALMERYRARFEQAPRELHNTLAALLDEIGYEGEIERQYKQPEQQLARSAVLEQLVESMKEYVERNREPSLTGFLEDSALGGREEDNDKDDRLAANSIKLMTLHSAKGLEFPHVYLVGLEEGLLPHRRSIEIGGAAIEEERRLAYVGITRAMDRLTISHAATRRKWGKPRKTTPSRFLWEMANETQWVEIQTVEGEDEV